MRRPLTDHDQVVRIGDAHSACQDYARSDVDFAVVSDGCSDERDTDVGARLLCLAAGKYKGYITSDPVRFFGEVVREATRNRKALGLPTTSLYATLLALVATDDAFHCFVSGDGAIVAVDRETRRAEVHVFDYDSRSYYPAYSAEQDTKGNHSAFALKRSVVRLTDGESSDVETLAVSTPRFCTVSFPRDRYEAVIAATDGIFTFTAVETGGVAVPGLERRLSPVALHEVVRTLAEGLVAGRPFLSIGLARTLSALAGRGGEAEIRDDLALAGLIDWL